MFGVISAKLVPFSKPLFTEGQLIRGTSGENPIQTSEEPGLEVDVLHFRVWTGNFFVIVPLRVDWLQAKVAPAWRCSKMTPRGPRPLCQFRVEAERVPENDMTFVRLHPEPEEEGSTPAHVVVKKDSKIEFLAAEAELLWQEEPEGIGFNVSDDVWLKVRIDATEGTERTEGTEGKEGWIHTQEDFQAIGLPQAG